MFIDFTNTKQCPNCNKKIHKIKRPKKVFYQCNECSIQFGSRKMSFESQIFFIFIDGFLWKRKHKDTIQFKNVIKNFSDTEDVDFTKVYYLDDFGEDMTFEDVYKNLYKIKDNIMFE